MASSRRWSVAFVAQQDDNPNGGFGRILAGKNALVTGASRGIGRSIALGLAASGANIAINYNRSSAEAEAVAKEAAEYGVKTCVVQADVTVSADVKRLKQEVNDTLGSLDILVNNAGVNVDLSFKKMTDEAWHQVVATNLTAVYNVTKTFLDDLTSAPGHRVINVSSFVGQRGNYGQTNYAASKGGIIAFTKTLAVELARDGVTVNAVAPGFIETDMLHGVPDRIKEKLLVEVPLHRFGKPEEIANAVVFLASPQAAYITGEILNVNGGIYMG